MQVSFFLPSGSKGGAEQLAYQLILEYQKNEHEIVLFFLTSKDVKSFLSDIQNDKTIVYFSPFNREIFGYFILPFYCIYHTLKYKKLSLIFTTHVHINALVALYRKFHILNSSTHVARESTMVFQRFVGLRLFMLKFFYHIGYHFIPHIVCQTALMKDDLVKNLPWLNHNSNIIILSNPINLNQVKINSLIPFNKPTFEYIVAAGSLTHIKGFDILIKAFDKCLVNFPHLKLLILGEGIMRKELEKLIEILGISNNVILQGWQKNIYPFLKYSKLCVVSSRVEGFPNVLLQKMACNNTVLSTSCAGDIEEIPGIYHCKSGDVDQMTSAILKALTTNNDEQRFVFDRFLKNRTVEDYVFKLNMLF